MSAAVASSLQNPQPPSAGIPAAVMTAVHFRKDYARLLEAVTLPDERIPQLLLEGLESDDANIVLRAVESISPIFETVASKEKFYDFLSLGGHTLLVLTLRKWRGNLNIVSYCCCCIARMIQKYEIGDKKFHVVRPLRLAGCMDHVVTALLNFKHSNDVHTYGIAALGNLCSGSSHYPDANKAAQRLASDLNGISIVVNSMKRFPTEETLQEVACCFLARLCFLGLGGLPSMKDEALLPLSEAVKSYPDNRIIETNAASFMVSVLHS